VNLLRDSSDRLIFSLTGVSAEDFPKVCQQIAEAFQLTTVGEMIVGPDQMFWDFGRDHLKLSLDWDIWMQFSIVAKTQTSEQLLHEIAEWFRTQNPQATSVDSRLQSTLMDEPLEVIPLVGFDPEGEPQIRRMVDGRLVLVFEFMPPSWAEDVPERFNDFDQQLSQAIGIPVIWEDRERFLIRHPQVDTVERLREFLSTFSR
jgi:hypothetical protein